ncbi:Uncharacterised protein at_DN1494 [Pycnogonum litorale]
MIPCIPGSLHRSFPGSQCVQLLPKVCLNRLSSVEVTPFSTRISTWETARVAWRENLREFEGWWMNVGIFRISELRNNKCYEGGIIIALKPHIYFIFVGSSKKFHIRKSPTY